MKIGYFFCDKSDFCGFKISRLDVNILKLF